MQGVGSIQFIGPNLAMYGSPDAKFNATGSTVHNLTSIPAGALLVLSTASQLDTSNNCSVSSSPSLTWTKQVDPVGSGGSCEIWTAVFEAGGNIDITSAWIGTTYQSSVCYGFTNQEGTLGGATATGTAQNVPNVNINSTRANSYLIAVTGNWNSPDGGSNGASIVWRGSPTQTSYNRSATDATLVHYYYSASTVQSYAVGWTAPNDPDGGGNTAVLEIRGG